MNDPSWMTGLDHPVVAVADMAAARAAYERLGFTIPGLGSHVEWGTGNWCIMFERDYLELRGVVRPGRTHNLDQFLEHYGEGLMGLALGTRDAHVSHRELCSRGFHPREVQRLTRNFELPGETVQLQFSLCFLDESESGGLMSTVFCQHLTPKRLRRPEWLRHANGAVGVQAVTGVVADLDAASEVQSRLFGRDKVVRDADAVVVDAGPAAIRLLSAAAARKRYPEAADLLAAGRPRLIAITLATRSLAAAKSLFDAGGVEYRAAADGIVAPPRYAAGAILEFVQSSEAAA
ncbi:MAG: hypothetical protein DCC67_00930 [Planctomycetota bacterium]|nr:MAG: hypothetical protein DCC67_00930 [Planctomycetota bacterium]